MRPVHRSLVSTLGLALALLGAGTAAAQTPNIRVAGRVQTQFASYSGDSSGNWNPHAQASSGFEIRRLRIQADVRIGENVNMVLQPSFEMGALRLRDAYLRVLMARSATSGFGFTMGQEKKPFSRYELTSSNTLPSIERGIRVRGLTGALAQNNLLEENAYIAHDIGASVDWYGMDNRAALKVGMYQGVGESAVDVNNAKSFGARLTGTVIQDEERLPVLRLGAAVFSRDRPITTGPTGTTFAPDSSRRSTAFAIDAEWGDFRPGLHVIADFATGEGLLPGNHCLNGATPISCRVDVGRNTTALRPGAPDSAFATFMSLQVIGAWRWQLDDPTGNRLIKIVEPALRVDYTDPNTDAGDNQSMLITPVINIYWSQTTILRAGLDILNYHDAAGASQSLTALRISWQANF